MPCMSYSFFSCITIRNKTVAYLYLNINIIFLEYGKQISNGEYVWFSDFIAIKKRSSKSVFVILADGRSATYTIYYGGIILDRNGLHEKSFTAARQG